MSRVGRLLRDLTGRAEGELVALLVAQIDVVQRSARLLEGRLRDDRRDGLLDAVQELEEEGDRRRHELVAHLTQTLSTPIDREDVFRVSRGIDDIVDSLCDFAREVELYAPARVDRCLPLLRAILDGLDSLLAGVEAMKRHPGDVERLAREAKQHANVLRREFEGALADLFSGELVMDTLRERELLRRLDIVALRLSESADALSDGRLKRA